MSRYSRIEETRDGTIDSKYCQAIRDSAGRLCSLCHDVIMPSDKIHGDHTIPLVPRSGEAGEHTADNYHQAHDYCNLIKNNRNPLSGNP